MKRAALATIAALAIVMGLSAPAMADSAGGTGTLSVTVPTAISFTFVSPNSILFGQVPPGNSAESIPGFVYEIVTNSGGGAHLDYSTSTPDDQTGNITFGIRKGELGGAYASLGDSLTVLNWRTGILAGSTQFSDNFNVTVGSNAQSGTYGQSITYTATTN